MTLAAPLVVLWVIVAALNLIIPNEIAPRRTYKPKPSVPKAWVHRG